jgi:hypothetical protein
MSLQQQFAAFVQNLAEKDILEFLKALGILQSIWEN